MLNLHRKQPIWSVPTSLLNLKKINIRMKKEERKYLAPVAQTIEFSSQAIICQSGDIDPMEIDGETGHRFN